MAAAGLALGLAAGPAGGPSAPHPAAAAPIPAAPGSLPDSVVVRLPHKDLTVSAMEATWARLDARYRPSGEPAQRARAFVDQLIEKEAMARAALAEPFTMSPAESARFVAFRQNLERQELYRLIVADSARVTPADRDSARRQLAAAPGATPPAAEAVETAARTRAEQRRAREVDAWIRSSLAPAWDDSVAALLAAGYAAVDSATPSLDQPLSATLRERRPSLAPADTARVLVRSTAGPLTAAAFARRFAALNPLQTPLPTSPGTVKARGEQFLGQMWFDVEVARRAIASRPSLIAALAERRESIALDHWYDRHVRAAVDTSQAALAAHYAADPARFGVTAHANVVHWSVPTQAAADSIVRVLAGGTPWDSLCARLGADEREREICRRTLAIHDEAPDSATVARLKTLAPGEAYVRPEPESNSFRVVRLVERVPARVRPFAEVREFVARDWAGRQAEEILARKMAALVEAMPARVNDAALARVRLAP
jgi:hypothetical protein